LESFNEHGSHLQQFLKKMKISILLRLQILHYSHLILSYTIISDGDGVIVVVVPFLTREEMWLQQHGTPYFGGQVTAFLNQHHPRY
jgi:hypothetical protein